jgi:hypothetical protein
MRPGQTPPVINNIGVIVHPSDSSGVITIGQSYTNPNWYFSGSLPLNASNQCIITVDIRSITPPLGHYSLLGYVEYTSLYDGTIRIYTARSTAQRQAIVLSGISTGTSGGITTNSATITGSNITSNGGDNITAGVCWGTSINPTVSGSKTTDTTIIGIFNSSITGLLGGTLYYVRAYVTNEAGTIYGNQVSFTTTLPSISIFNYNTYIVTSNAPSGLLGEIRFDMTVENGINLIPGIEQSLFSNFSTVERSSDGNIISSSPATVTLSGFGDFATLASPNETRYYRGYVRNSDSSIKVYSPNPVRSFQFEDIRLTSLTYDAANNRFVAVIQFYATSGRVVNFIGIISRKDSIDPASSPFGITVNNATGVTSATNTYTVLQSAASLVSGETLKARAFVQISGSSRQFSYNLGSITKP